MKHCTVQHGTQCFFQHAKISSLWYNFRVATDAAASSGMDIVALKK